MSSTERGGPLSEIGLSLSPPCPLPRGVVFCPKRVFFSFLIRGGPPYSRRNSLWNISFPFSCYFTIGVRKSLASREQSPLQGRFPSPRVSEHNKWSWRWEIIISHTEFVIVNLRHSVDQLFWHSEQSFRCASVISGISQGKMGKQSFWCHPWTDLLLSKFPVSLEPSEGRDVGIPASSNKRCPQPGLSYLSH